MASSDFWQKLSTSLAEWDAGVVGSSGSSARGSRGTAKMWMVMDALTVFLAAIGATLYKFHTTPVEGARDFFRGTLFHGLSMWILLSLLCGFTCALIVTSKRLHLYTPMHMTNFLHEQRMSARPALPPASCSWARSTWSEPS